MEEVTHILLLLLADERIHGYIDEPLGVLALHSAPTAMERERVLGDWGKDLEGLQAKFFQSVFASSARSIDPLF